MNRQLMAQTCRHVSGAVLDLGGIPLLLPLVATILGNASSAVSQVKTVVCIRPAEPSEIARTYLEIFQQRVRGGVSKTVIQS